MKDGWEKDELRRVALCCREADLGAAIAAVLRSDGCDVSGCDCEAATLDNLVTAAPDVIVIEAGTRDAAALELCRTVRREATLSGARLLVLTDSGRKIARRRAEALGANAVLAMPVGMEAVRTEVERLLGHHT